MNYKVKTYLIMFACLPWALFAIVSGSACINAGGAFHIVCGIGCVVSTIAALLAVLSRVSKEYSEKYLAECNPRKKK